MIGTTAIHRVNDSQNRPRLSGILKRIVYGSGYILGRRVFHRNTPLICGLTLTDRCNLRCRHCRVANRRKPDLMFTEATRAIDTFYDEGGRTLHLRTQKRTYPAKEVTAAVDRAVNKGFECVNAEIMFALPGQTCAEVEETGHALVEMYLRIYETRFAKASFDERFGKDFDETYGRIMKALALMGFLRERSGEIVLSDRGTFWLHALEDLFSIDYVSKLWGDFAKTPWPERVVL